MCPRLPYRLLRLFALACVLLPACGSAWAQRGRAAHGPTAPQTHPAAPSRSAVGPGRNQEHLPQWINRHSSLSPQEQQRALEHEPGFHQLAPDTQQRMRNRLTELNNMSPERRQRVIERNEALERLSPNQRQDVRGAMSDLRALPLDRRRAVSRAFRQLRSEPQQQRQSTLQSDQFRSQFSPSEQNTLNNLMRVEPLLPPQNAPPSSPR